MNYTIEKPRLPVTVWLLAVVIVIGLIALGIAAYTAFSQVAGPVQAFFAAAVVEISMIVEALALVRGKNWIGLAGMAVSLAVSGTYNYIQAEQAGKLHDITNGWQLITLALGPLLALAFLSLTLGREIKTHEISVKAWQDGKSAWEKEQETRRLQLEYQKEKLRLETESKTEIAKARIEARKNTAQPGGNLPEISGRQDWRNLPDEDKVIIRTMRTPDIMSRYNVSDRTARNWRAAAQNGNHKGGLR